MVLLLDRREGTTEIGSRIALGPAGSDGVPEHPPAVLMRPVRCLDGAARFDAPQDLQKLRRRALADRAGAQPREDVPLEAPGDLAGVPRSPARGVLGEPLPRDRLEAVFAATRSLRGLARHAGVDAGG